MRDAQPPPRDDDDDDDEVLSDAGDAGAPARGGGGAAAPGSPGVMHLRLSTQLVCQGFCLCARLCCCCLRGSAARLGGATRRLSSARRRAASAQLGAAHSARLGSVRQHSSRCGVDGDDAGGGGGTPALGLGGADRGPHLGPSPHSQRRGRCGAYHPAAPDPRWLPPG